MIKKHWTPTFAVNKLIQKFQTKKEKDCPWISYDTIKFLKQYLRPEDIILETGSGRSTIWFSRLVKKVVSIENHDGWYQQIKGQMAEEEITNVEYYLESKDFSTIRTDAPYVKRVASFPDQSFDMVLIDGRHRDEIAHLSLNLIKKNGIIVIDNIERCLHIPELSLPDSLESANKMSEKWRLFFNKVKNNRKVIFNDGITAAIVIFGE